MECCSDIQFDTTAIDSIVMPDERKMVIKSLVYRFSDTDAINGKIPAPWTADFVQNKGEGQIFLLHGSPGVGKTLVSSCLLLLMCSEPLANNIYDRLLASRSSLGVYFLIKY